MKNVFNRKYSNEQSLIKMKNMKVTEIKSRTG